MRISPNLLRRIRRHWPGIAIGSMLGLLMLGSAVEGQVGSRLPDPQGPGNRFDPLDDRWRNTPSTQPPQAGIAPSDELRRLQSELDALSRAQGMVAEPVPTISDSIAERVKLKERLIELIEKLKPNAYPAPPAANAQSRPTDATGEQSKPVDRLRQAQNLYRSGEVKSAQQALRQIEPSTLSLRHAALARYMNASCYRRLGDFDQAKKIYGDIAKSKEDEFLSQCATWHLQAIQTREEMAAPTDKTPTPSPPK